MGKTIYHVESILERKRGIMEVMSMKKFQRLLLIISLLVLFLVVLYCAMEVTDMYVHQIKWRSDWSVYENKRYIIAVLSCGLLYSISTAILYKTSSCLTAKNQDRASEFWFLSILTGLTFLIFHHLIFNQQGLDVFNAFLSCLGSLGFLVCIYTILFDLINILLEDKKFKIKNTRTKKTEITKMKKKEGNLLEVV